MSATDNVESGFATTDEAPTVAELSDSDFEEKEETKDGFAHHCDLCGYITYYSERLPHEKRHLNRVCLSDKCVNRLYESIMDEMVAAIENNPSDSEDSD